MTGVVERVAATPVTHPHVAARIALLGVGTVGAAFLRRLQVLQRRGLARELVPVYVANSNVASLLGPSSRGRGGGEWIRRNGTGESSLGSVDPRTESPSVQERRNPPPVPWVCAPFEHLLPHAEEGWSVSPSNLDSIASALATTDGSVPRILIDATASDAVAARHAGWLAQGIHVVTACKLGQGTTLQRWRDIQAARAHGATQYGDSATVGAGLPLLRTLRALHAGGDRIHAIAGVLSGSLAWLFHHYDGRRPFSGFVRDARDAGYTEPDPRDDLSGEDVRRKLLILARTAGVELAPGDVAVQSLVPPALAGLPRVHVDAALPMLDGALRARFAEAWKRGERLRFVARLQDGRARVGLESLAADDPLAGGSGTDNRVAIWSDRYRVQPLVIQGPGAGAEVTAAALLDDALSVL